MGIKKETIPLNPKFDMRNVMATVKLRQSVCDRRFLKICSYRKSVKTVVRAMTVVKQDRIMAIVTRRPPKFPSVR